MLSFASFVAAGSSAPIDRNVVAAEPLLIVTLVFGLLSFLSSIYTITRILLPLLPHHVLHRRRSPYALSTAKSKSIPQIKTAHRFNVYLTIIDLVSVCLLIGEAAVSATGETGGLGMSVGGVVRIWICVSARGTVLFVASFLAYINIVKGKTIHLGKFDWLLWFPALVVILFGALLSTVNYYNSERSSWIGLLSLLTTFTLSTSLFFLKLLYAIAKVVKGIKSHRPYSIWGQSINAIRESYLPPLYLNSNLSDTFVRETQYETSTSTNDLSSDEIPSTPVVVHGRSPYGVFEVPQSVDPLRPSIDSGSPSHFSASHLADLPFSFESLPRPSFDSTTASESTGQGGIVGSSTLRIAMQVEEGDWSRRAAYGRSPTATLSEKEVRGAVVRIGGHLAGCLLSYILAAPFLFSRALGGTTTTAADVAFVLSICTSSISLAANVAIADGFWFKVHFEAPSTVLAASGSTLSIHIPPMMSERTRESMTPSMRNEAIRRMDFDERKNGRLSRAFAMVAPHPKLLLLPTHLAGSSSTQFASGVGRNSQHLRLRSLPISTAGKKSVEFSQEVEGYEGRRKIDSRASFGGFSTRSIAPPYSTYENDQLITRSLLAASRQSHHHHHTRPSISSSLAPSARARQFTSPSPTPTWTTFDRQTSTPSPSLPPHLSSPLLSPDFLPVPPPDEKMSLPSIPPNYSIDRLSRELIPRLVPSVRLGRRSSVLPYRSASSNSDRVESPIILGKMGLEVVDGVDTRRASLRDGEELAGMAENGLESSTKENGGIGRRGQDFDEVDRMEQALRRESRRFERDEAEEDALSSDDGSEGEPETRDSTMEILADVEMNDAHEESFTEELAREGEEQIEDESLIDGYQRRTTMIPSSDETESVYGTTIDLSHLTVPADDSGDLSAESQGPETFDTKEFANESVEGMLAQLDNFILRSERNSTGSTSTTVSDRSRSSEEEEDNGVITFASIESVHHLSQLSPRSFASSFSLKRGDSTGGLSWHERSGSFGSISESLSNSPMDTNARSSPQAESIISPRISVSEVETLRSSTLLSPDPTSSFLPPPPSTLVPLNAPRLVPARRRLFIEPIIDIDEDSPAQFSDAVVVEEVEEDTKSISSSGTPTPKARRKPDDSRSTTVPPLPNLVLTSLGRHHNSFIHVPSASSISQVATGESRILSESPFFPPPAGIVLPLSPQSRRRYAVKNPPATKSTDGSGVMKGIRVEREEVENVDHSEEVPLGRLAGRRRVWERELKMLR